MHPSHDDAETTVSRAQRLANRVEQLYAADEQIRSARPSAEVSTAMKTPGLRLAQIVAEVMRGYAERAALSERVHELATDTETGRTSRRLLPGFASITYEQLWTRVQALAAALRQDSRNPLEPGALVCLLGFTSADYTTVELACLYLGAVSVPLQSGASAAQHLPIIAETQPTVIAVNIGQLDVAVEAVLAGQGLRTVVILDYAHGDDDHRERFEDARRRIRESGKAVAVDELGAVIARGDNLPRGAMHVPETEDAPLSVFYTSGSTGTPKGTVYTERMVRAGWLAGRDILGAAAPPMIYVSYLPMSHRAGQTALIATLASGGTVFFTAKSDLSTLFDDIARVRPTLLFLVPRVCEMIAQRFTMDLERRLARGTDAITAKAEATHQARTEMLGGRVLAANTGSAPLAKPLKSLIESLLDVHLADSYGSTELGIVWTDGKVRRPPIKDYKLLDVPRLGYFGTDKPYPRGELLVKSELTTPGYFKRPDLTASMFDVDGFYRTGDIVAELSPDQLLYVDRRNNVLKMSQGEFVAISHVEGVLAVSPLIHQIFVHGVSERSFLLAVVVPTAAIIARVGDGVEDNDAITAEVMSSLHTTAREAHLNSFEIPRGIILEPMPFSVENGLLAGTGKLLRPNLKERYARRLDRLYAKMADAQADELRALRNVAVDHPSLDAVRRAVAATLGLSPSEVDPAARFIDLGGDSLSALSFTELLVEVCGVDISVNTVLDPSRSLERLALHIDGKRASKDAQPTFAQVHGNDLREIRAEDLTVGKFVDEHLRDRAATLPPHDGRVNTVLLTGANGYLGRFLALEWLQRLAPVGGTLICVARASDAADARQRLEAAMSTDDELVRRFSALAEDHLEVLAGDISEPRLGLDDVTWARLADQVDLIVHPAAHVNHVLPYGQLFRTNVVGTAELIRLAMTSKLKGINYISTVAVADTGEGFIDEDEDVRTASARRALDGKYVSGYAATKWAGEVLMREVHDLCGLPVTVFRCDMILAHSRFKGQVNVSDVFTRLLLSLATTGIAPRSFYPREGSTRARAHWDGLSVDFVAKAIASLGEQHSEGFTTYNVVNPHDDDVSLDRFVEWLVSAGYPISYIDDYDEWMSRFETALRILPDTERRISALPVLDGFRRPQEAVRGTHIPAGRFHQAIRGKAVGTYGDIPHVSVDLIHKYLTDLTELGLLADPTGR